MNTATIKAYAPKARNDFIQAVTERANLFGIYGDDHIEPMEIKGDVTIIGERVFTLKAGELRNRLIQRIQRDGFNRVMESVAYTWFNRFVAIRYMEINGYLDHGCRVFSNPGGSEIPEILTKAADIDLSGLDKVKVIELRLAGDKDNELFRMLLIAQCNALHESMPFLFDAVDSETELLLPDNILHTNSVIRKMVNAIEENLWKEVEIIGWIYQFYISEKKDQVIGKVVKSEDIPAATQLFTPKWIVRYMVQNTLGRMWMAAYPDSALKDKMEYYIEPARQEPDVQLEIDRITPKELNPEAITFLDPACGSGHILAEAYDLFKEIYLERGYRTRDIPRIVLEKNLFGLEIDDRAAQLAGFAVLMKARQDDRRIFARDDVKMNVMAIQEGTQTDLHNIQVFFKGEDQQETRDILKELVKIFENGKTFGSLITIPDHIAEKMDDIKAVVNEKLGGWLQDSDAQNIKVLVDQASILAKKYDCVVTNPPYMGSKGMNALVKDYLKNNFTDVKSDLFAAFILRNTELAAPKGQLGFMSPFVWMFISSYEKLRSFLLDYKTITTLIQLEYSGFDGATVPICTFTIENVPIAGYRGGYVRLSNFRGSDIQGPKALEIIQNYNKNIFSSLELCV
jgi:SAM-dependent methyltransferase